jgi:hypothetical protein
VTTQNQTTKAPGSGAIRFRWFPIRLYSYVIGAGVFGWGIGTGMESPGTGSLIALLAGTGLTVAGYRWMRPYMNLARAEIAQLQAERMQKSEGENDVAG